MFERMGINKSFDLLHERIESAEKVILSLYKEVYDNRRLILKMADNIVELSKQQKDNEPGIGDKEDE